MKQSNHKSSSARSGRRPRSLPISEWPKAYQQAWEEACRPGTRFRRGRASRYAQGSRDDFASRCGAFLGSLQRSGSLDPNAAAAAQITPSNVESYVAELNKRVRSVTVWNCVYKLRMAATLLDPEADFTWLAEIEKDLALVMVPRNKFDRVVLSERLVEAGLTLVAEAELSGKSPFERAKAIRNGLMIALLAVCPIRVKNFAALEIGRTFRKVNGSWWISLPYKSTKTKASEERPVPEFLNHAIDIYLTQARPVLIGLRPITSSLWISSTTGKRYTTKNLGTLISKITFRTIGVDVSPHLFRTAGATTAAMYGGDNPHLASAFLGHSDSRMTYEHYVRGSSINAAKQYGALVRQYYSPQKSDS